MTSFPGNRRILHHAAALGAVLAASAAYPQTFGTEGQIRAVVTATDAYIPVPARLIAQGRVDYVVPDPRGRYVLVSRREPEPLTGGDEVAELPYASAEHPALAGEVSLILYDSHTGRVRTIWEQPAPDASHPIQGSISAVVWFPATDTAVAVVSTELVNPEGNDAAKHETSKLLLIRAPSRRVTEIVQGSRIWPEISRGDAPMGVVRILSEETDGKAGPSRFATLDPLGNLNALPELDAEIYRTIGSSADGHTFYFYRRALPGEVRSADDYHLRHIAFDLQTRSITPLSHYPESQTLPPIVNVLKLTSGEIVARSPATPPAKGTSTIVNPLFLMRGDGNVDKSGLPDSIMVAPHADNSLLLADDSAVLFQSQQTLYAVPLLRIPLSDYNQLLRERVIANAKRLARAIYGYTQDYDGFLPLANSDSAVFSPYVQSETWLEDPATGAMGFRYQLNGQSLAGFGSPETQITGSIDCVFGRATIFADGHVVWTDLK